MGTKRGARQTQQSRLRHDRERISRAQVSHCCLLQLLKGYCDSMSAPVYYRSRAAEKVRLSFKILEDRQRSAGRPGAEWSLTCAPYDKAHSASSLCLNAV
jgi:hypothetical protein